MWSPSRAGEESARAGARAGPPRLERRLLAWLSLLTSFGTLICCALPALLVLIGLGAAVASLLSSAPWLVALSRHKEWVFAASGALIALNAIYTHGPARKLRVAGAGCARDDGACGEADWFTRMMLWSSAGIYAAGLFAAYALAPLLTWLYS